MKSKMNALSYLNYISYNRQWGQAQLHPLEILLQRGLIFSLLIHVMLWPSRKHFMFLFITKMSRLLKMKEDAIKYIELFQLYQIQFDPLSEKRILRDGLTFFRLKKKKEQKNGQEFIWEFFYHGIKKPCQYVCVALENKVTGRNLCQIDFTADKKPRANKQLSIAKIKIARVIAYSMKPQGKKKNSFSFQHKLVCTQVEHAEHRCTNAIRFHPQESKFSQD